MGDKVWLSRSVVITRALGEGYLQTSGEVLCLSHSFLDEDIPETDMSIDELINATGNTHSVPNLFPISSVCRVPKV
jgi:hypothetical protein